SLDWRWCSFVLAQLISSHPSNSRRLVGVTLPAKSVRRGVRADPQTDLDRPIAELPPSLFVLEFWIIAHQFEAADDTARAAQLIEREQTQRIPHDDGDAGA